MIQITQAETEDAREMSRILQEILLTWNSQRPGSEHHITEHYILHPDRISCAVALDDAGSVLGFQSLKAATEGNPFGLPIGWGAIGTYVDEKKRRHGVGKALFAETLRAANKARIPVIDATIGANDIIALSYYRAMGFETYSRIGEAICKKLVLA